MSAGDLGVCTVSFMTVLHCRKAIAAINGAALAGIKGNCCRHRTLGTLSADFDTDGTSGPA